MPSRAILRPLASLALLAALAAAVALACGAKRAEGEPFSLVSLDEVQAMLSQPDVAVIDANTRKTFEKNHLPGARFLESRAALAGILPADRSTRLVFYCASPS